MNSIKLIIAALLLISSALLLGSCRSGGPPDIRTGNVIFIHPDGSGPSMWAALRIYRYGPDSLSNWERMERMGLYRSHVLNSTNSSSHGGATIHSYGVKVNFNTYGSCPEKPVKSLSGKGYSIMAEARKAGMATALINSGHICEPGTGVYVSGSVRRSDTDHISEQIIESGTDIILSGGEVLLLPEGRMGRHGEPGVREDGKNLIERARELGYTVVYNSEELMNLPPDADKVLGVFAPLHTFNAHTEEYNKDHDLAEYRRDAPSLEEMTRAALRIMDRKGEQFLMVVEEEGSDNFGNSNNARGVLAALERADRAIAAAMEYAEREGNTLVITAADSDAGGMQLISVRDEADWNRALPDIAGNGAPVDGVSGKNTIPFTAAPDINGKRLRFGVVWSCYDDVAGSIIARAHGLNADLLKNNLDNTDIYRISYATLFGRMLPPYNPLLEELPR
ncbi:MAG: alkaline phosphatase [Candidatus Latescibacteria bacterium]|nr:alkaline phosphatase [bacterium]MBD3423616.1 alkaline phosphatase [Candidatus Latescibacterota bacterium]